MIASDFSFVGSGPQLAHTDEQFSAYLGIWRPIRDGQFQAVGVGRPGSLLSKRDVAWTVQPCNGSASFQSSESLWYRDKLAFDESGDLIPIPEAGRKGYLYFSMMHFNSMHAKLLGRFSPPDRGAGESSAEFAVRRSAALRAWRKDVAAVGTSGEVRVVSTQRVYANSEELLDEDQVFMTVDDYRREGAPFFSLMDFMRPERWPVVYDERAHKLHSVLEPKVWASHSAVDEKTISFTLKWNWCDASAIRAELEVPRGQDIAPDVNRYGRSAGPQSNAVPVVVED